LIEKLDDSTDVNYYAGLAPPGLANRDFVTMKSYRYEYKQERMWILLNRSVVHPKVPEKEGYVRGHSFGTGNLIRETEDGKSLVTYCAQADLKGWIPAWAITMVTTINAPKSMEKLEKACKEFDEWMKENPGEDKVLYEDDTSNSNQTLNN